MLDKKITRKEFLKTWFLGIMAVFIAPLSRMFNGRERVSNKDAKYYKDLAG